MIGGETFSVVTLDIPADDTNIAQQQYMAKNRRNLDLGIYRERYILKPIFDSDNNELFACIQVTRNEPKRENLVAAGKIPNFNIFL